MLSATDTAPPPLNARELLAESRTPDDLEAAGWVGDASGLGFVHPARIVPARSADDVRAAYAFAQTNGLNVTTSGTRHAMGGQAIRDGAVMIDTRAMNAMHYDPATGYLTVQAGATWADAQRTLDPYGRSVAVMQSSNIFSVGGTISANAHGRDVRFGPIGETVASLRVMLPSGQIVNTSRSEHPELFSRVIGGYGLYGTILDATIATVPNELYHRVDADLTIDEFPQWWADNVANNPDARLLQARLSMAPHNGLLNDVHVISYERASDEEIARAGITALPPLENHDSAFALLWEKTAFKFAQNHALGRDMLWWMQQHVDPIVRGSRLVTRNEVMSPDVEYLRSGPSDHTQVLQEYFVPREQLPSFVHALRSATQRHDVEILNATIRDVPRDTTSVLKYAPGDSFSVVLYIDHDATDAAVAHIDEFAREVTDAAVALGGKPYLPYRLAYRDDQLARAYPHASEFLALRSAVDPANTLHNSVTDAFSGR